jgi:hypothetical protein
MENMIKMTAEELYYLGSQMQAKYIDYDYISAMNDIQKNYRLYESDAVNDLMKKGLIEEDFSGNITVSFQMEELLIPIFFGNFEAEIDVCDVRKESRKIIKLHTEKEKITMVEVNENDLILKNMHKNDVLRYGEEVFQFMEDQTGDIEFEEQKVSEIYIMKNTVIGGESDVRILFRIENSVFMENENEEIQRIEISDLMREIQSILIEKGE